MEAGINMDLEIERRFLVEGLKWKHGNLLFEEKISQTYVVADPEKVIRVREVISKDSEKSGHFMTLKGKRVGYKCPEIEFKIPEKKYLDIVEGMGSLGPVKKTRYTYEAGDGLYWQIDVFENKELSGLIIAEIELESETQDFYMPSWLGKEISKDHRYSNLCLARDGMPL
jgi:adenylate cyclase